MTRCSLAVSLLAELGYKEELSMVKLIPLVLTLVLVLTTPYLDRVYAQDTLSWRQRAPDHYYNNQCCYCASADRMRMTKGGPEYFALGKWYSIPPKFNRPPDPQKPTNGIVICDPEQRKFLCVLFNGGV